MRCWWITQVGRCIFFSKFIRLYLSCYKCWRQWHCINLHQPKFTVKIFTSIVIHRIDFSPPDQILNYWFIHKVSYASNIFCCLALSLPSNFASAQSSMTWQSAGTEIILMAQIQHCCLHATLVMKKAEESGVSVDLVCRCYLLAPVHGDRCVYYVLCADHSCVASSASLEHLWKLIFTKSENWILMKRYIMKWPNRKSLEEKITWEY